MEHTTQPVNIKRCNCPQCRHVWKNKYGVWKSGRRKALRKAEWRKWIKKLRRAPCLDFIDNPVICGYTD